ncbi:MAG: Trk system potassium transporter TrkA [Methanomassiliicoccaceae archaeon]|nr:Trk system potassium transporter TrkA [Methanomassiliicoccaceae archaeon]
MNIIIIGAGNVGSTIAGVLSNSHNVLMIETDSHKAEIARSGLNVSVLQENGVNPKVIEDAIGRHAADVLIAAMPYDENNLFSCIVAKNAKNSIRTVSKIRNPDFIKVQGDGAYFGTDMIVSPELSTSKKLSKLAVLENAVDYNDIEKLGLAVAIFLVTDIHRGFAGHAMVDIRIPDNCTIMSVYRKGKVILYKEMTEVHAGDFLCVLGTPDSISEFNEMMGYTREAKEITIIGGGIVGSNVARMLENEKLYLKMIEHNPEQCKKLVRDVDNTLVINADGVDPEVLRSENTGRADVVILATDSDEKNLLGSLVSKDLGAQKIISRYSKREYEDVFAVTGIMSIVGYHRLIANEIMKTLISDEKALMKMNHDEETLFMVKINKDSRIAGMPLGDLQFPEGSRAVCIMRDGTAIFPRLDTRLEKEDNLLLYTYETKLHKIEKLFGIRIMDV